MKYLKYFENKNVTDVEDLLLTFMDSGELTHNTEITSYISSIEIILDFGHKNKGMEGVRLVDKIIKRLHKKFEYIYVSENIIYIDLISQGEDDGENEAIYLSYNNSFENRVKQKIKFINSYTIEMKSNQIRRQFSINKENILFNYLIRDKILTANEVVMNMFEKDFCLIPGQIRDIIEKEILPHITNKFKLDVKEYKLPL